MPEDPIVNEVRRVRDEHASRHGYDLRAIYKALKEREESSGREHVSYPSRKPEPVAIGEGDGASPKG
ncbi:MAG: hypothetical protein E2P02_14185 [Acidobacteria bacterium]|nr:MAG: hypothetical protein E2P02_14185 [Acidobacteriota bacterium]